MDSILTVSKKEIRCAMCIASRNTFNNHIKKSGVQMPDWWYNQRVFHSWQIPTIEHIFKIDLQKKASQN